MQPLKYRPHSTDEVRVRNAKPLMNWLPRPVLDRIRRYASEGRVPLVRYEHGYSLLLAVATGQIPVVVLRAPSEEFAELRRAVLVEWTRTAKRKMPQRGLRF